MRATSALPLIGLVALCAGAGSVSAETFAYDALGRVVLYVSDNNSQTVYSYDAAGNRTTVANTTPASGQAPVAGPITLIYAYGSGPRTFRPRDFASDPNGLTLTVTGISAPVFGSASLSGSVVTYTPPTTNVSATDSFTYSIVNSAGLTASGVVLMTLKNLLPVAAADRYSYVFGGAASLTVDPRSNDTDPGGLALTITAVGMPRRGTVTTNGSSITYAPPADHRPGFDTFNYTIQDTAGGRASSTVKIALSNAAPVANADSITVPAGGYTTFNPLRNDRDASGNPLTVIAATNGSNGATSFSASSINYTANAGYAGPDGFSYTISDPYGATASANVSVTVQSTPNHPPTANDISIEASLAVPATVNACASASDPDGDALKVIAVTQPAKGDASFSGCSVTYDAPPSNLQTYTTFQYTVSDTHGATATATVHVQIDQSS